MFDCGSFIIFLLYFDNMLDACPNMNKIIDLKDHLYKTFEMKELEETNQTLGIKMHNDITYRNI